MIAAFAFAVASLIVVCLLACYTVAKAIMLSEDGDPFGHCAGIALVCATLIVLLGIVVDTTWDAVRRPPVPAYVQICEVRWGDTGQDRCTGMTPVEHVP